jgi:MoaA/NifB/PqqE/SkfB family radical SAM enzyme
MLPQAINKLSDAAKLAIQQRSHRIQVLPIVILYLNNVCDSRCITCSIWKNNEALRAAAERQMSDDLLEELYRNLEQWRSRQILLSGGEPALHPRFAETVHRLGQIAPKVCVITNGLLLGSQDPAALARVAEFYISFDGPDRESYLRIRGVDGFDRLAASVQVLRSLPKPPRIIARCTLQRDNVRRLPELMSSAKRIGFDAISFLGVDVSSAAFARDLHGAAEAGAIQPSLDDLIEMSSGIDWVRHNSDGFVEGGAEKLERIRQYLQALIGEAEFPIVRCNAPWVSVVIETTGKIRGCFFQPVIGDFRTINAEAALHFRRTLDVSSNPTCRRCVCSKWLGGQDLMRLA